MSFYNLCSPLQHFTYLLIKPTLEATQPKLRKFIHNCHDLELSPKSLQSFRKQFQTITSSCVITPNESKSVFLSNHVRRIGNLICAKSTQQPKREKEKWKIRIMRAWRRKIWKSNLIKISYYFVVNTFWGENYDCFTIQRKHINLITKILCNSICGSWREIFEFSHPSS